LRSSARDRMPAGSDALRSHPVYRLKAEMFRVLGHPVRVRMLELLRQGELPVRELQRELDLDSSGASQHLSALRKLGLLDARREGTSVYYRIRDKRTNQLLDVARQILTSNLEQSQALLGELAATAPPPPQPKRQRKRT
jgi:DNA-binding transcriptional ArsR family regulator